MIWVLIVGLVWLAVGLLVGIPLARAIRAAEDSEETLTGWMPSEPPAPTAAPRERPGGRRVPPRRPPPVPPRREPPWPGPDPAS
jgi:hypothetical protein